MSRGRSAAAALLIAAASASLSCRAVVRWQVGRLAKEHPDVLYSVATSARAVALTIDDGPDPATTPALLDVLARHEAHATFFIIASRVPGNEGVLRRMVAEGHELGNHLWRDEPSLRLEPAEFERQLVAADDVLSEFAPIWWLRPGSGKYDARMRETIDEHGYRCARLRLSLRSPDPLVLVLAPVHIEHRGAGLCRHPPRLGRQRKADARDAHERPARAPQARAPRRHAHRAGRHAPGPVFGDPG